MSDPNQSLNEQIERLVRKHIEATRREATAAMERAFAASVLSQTPDSAEPPKRATTTRVKKRRSPASGRRTADELTGLSERLYEAVIAEPGKTMTSLAPKVGATPRELHLPMMTLKREGRIRSVGVRQHTRYYPTATGR